MGGYAKLAWLALGISAIGVASACSGESSEQPATGGTGGTGTGGTSTGGTSTGGTSTGGTSTGGTSTGGTSTGGTGTGGTGTGGTGGGAPVRTGKVDLLFMIDNSASMADKQKVLAAAVPNFANRLASPYCVDSSGAFVTKVGANDACPSGSSREFPPVASLHIGVISSSLGSHGADSCSESQSTNWNPRKEDMAHLLDRSSTGSVTTYGGKGFLNWDPEAEDSPPGESDPAALAKNFGNIVRGAGQDGCGFESSLEAWYRFLIDPQPYDRMVPGPCFLDDTQNSCRVPEGIDTVVLQQRADFLRPDSSVVIVMLTDENDCSVVDSGQSYLVLQMNNGQASFHVARGTDACKDDPYSPDCMSCWLAGPSGYPECQAGWPDPELDDPITLRCYRQKQRFGIDFLYPVKRYVDALTKRHLEDGSINPLFCGSPSADNKSCTTPMRDATQIILAGIVGVPWQDLANDPNDPKAGYKTASEIDWNMIVGDPMNNVEPTDPLMIESVDPRSGTNPATGQGLASGPGVPNAINGAEWTIARRNDLQYACTFKLPQPIDCSQPENVTGCDCSESPESPLCWDGSGYGTMQHYGKAYPGRRQLSVLQGVQTQAVVASICAPNLTDPDAADYGYGPALDALTKRLAQNLQ